MREAIEKVTELALAFWESGAVGGSLCSGPWLVEPEIWQGGFGGTPGLEIRITGPTSDGHPVPWKVFVHPKGGRAAGADHEPAYTKSVAQRKRIIRARPGRLYYRRLRDNETWVLGLVAILLAQRGWVITSETEDWIWQSCLTPCLLRVKGGLQLLRTGAINFIHYRTLTTICEVYSTWQLRGFLSGLVKRVQRIQGSIAASNRAAAALEGEAAGTPAPHYVQEMREQKQYKDFLYQRRHRGQVLTLELPTGELTLAGVIERASTLVSWKEQWKRKRKAVELVRSIARRMVALGATEESARRQVRRWRKSGDTPEQVAARFRSWETRQARRRSRSGD